MFRWKLRSILLLLSTTCPLLLNAGLDLQRKNLVCHPHFSIIKMSLVAVHYGTGWFVPLYIYWTYASLGLYAFENTIKLLNMCKYSCICLYYPCHVMCKNDVQW